MDLTSAEIVKQKTVLADVIASFNDSVVPVAAVLTALRDAQPNPVLTAAIAAWENIMPALNANSPAIRAALNATTAMVPSDPPATPPLFSNDLSSVALIQRDFGHANAFYNPGPSLPTVDNPTVWINGLLQVPIILGLNSGPNIGGTGCSWHWWMPAAVMAAQELWAEYDFMIDPDVPAGFNEEGCKLPGLAGAWEQPGQWAEASGSYGWFSARLWHRRPDAAGNCELAGYVYSARSMDAKNPFGEIIATGKMLQPGVKYKLGQHIKLNSQDAAGKWLSDGAFEILLDGVVVFSDTAFKMRADPRATFQDFFVNIFHGGSQPVKAPIHYRIGGIVVDSKPIKPGSSTAGVGVVGAASGPAWRRGLKVGEWTEGIPVAWNHGVRAGGTFSGMASDRENAKIYWPGPGGHAVGDGAPVYALDLNADALSVAALIDQDPAARTTADQAYWPDGRPTGAHLYYSGQAAQIGGRTVVLRVMNSAGAFSEMAPSATDAFYPDRNEWAPRGTWMSPPDNHVESCVALDRRTNRIYTSNQNGVWQVLDVSALTWVRLPTRTPAPSWSGSVIVPSLNEHLYTLDDGTLEGRNLTTGVFTRRGNPTRCRAMLIQERFNRVYMIGFDSRFRSFDVATGAIVDLGPVPQPSTVYNRIEDFPTLGGILHLPEYGQPARFFATE